MKSYVLMIGDGAGALLPMLCGISAGMAGALPSLGILHLSSREESSPYPRIAEDLNACHAAFDAAGEPFFPAAFSYASCAVSLPDIRELSGRYLRAVDTLEHFNILVYTPVEFFRLARKYL